MSIDVVKQMYQAFGEGDMEKVFSFLADDVVWDHRGPPGAPISRLYEGKEGVREFFDELFATQEMLEFRADEYFGSGNRVVVLGFHSFRVKETGKEWESEFAATWTLEDGLITRWRPIHDLGSEAMAHMK
jgi:ketosteroid isomerase-like protein